MKPSNYNYYLPWEDDRNLFFNGLTRRFFFVSKKNSDAFKDVINEPDRNEEEYRGFLNKMLDEGFVVSDGFDEVQRIKQDFNELSRPNLYRIMVLPTLQCNVRCWYCVQKHVNIMMSKETLDMLKKHIEKYLDEHPEITELQISWFGGEPLLRFDIIEELNSYAIALCERKNISFSSGMTTNGTLLTPAKIDHCRDLKINGFQITIDGTEENHNKVKDLHSASAFKTSLTNISNLLKQNPEATCLLRVNFTPENLHPDEIINSVNQYIDTEYRDRVTIYPVKVWQVPQSEIDFNKVDKLCTDAIMNGYKSKHSLTGWCYVSYKHFNCFYPDGKVGKCDEDELEDAKGHLDTNGNIIWDDKYPFMSHSLLEETSECKDCRYLPFCYGPCPQTMDRMLKKYNRIKCYMTDKEKEMQLLISKYVRTIINNK